MTYSVLAAEPATGRIGAAIASRFLAVGAYCLYLDAGAGVVTQGVANPLLGVHGCAAIRAGEDPQACLDRLLAGDPLAPHRQTLAIDGGGRGAVRTGPAVHPAAATIADGHAVFAGNLLTDARVIEAMQKAWAADDGGGLAERLLAALAAGERAGGDRRGRQAAAIRIQGCERYAELDLRIDDCERSPVDALRDLHSRHLGSDVQAMRASLPVGTRASDGPYYPTLPDLQEILRPSWHDKNNL